jgi:hypothetical protein
MSQVITAIYENGVLKPLDRLRLDEHEHVRVTVESVPGPDGGLLPPAVDPLADLRVSTGIPDLAEHFDDYRFGRRQP